jgi:hypothetical protein
MSKSCQKSIPMYLCRLCSHFLFRVLASFSHATKTALVLTIEPLMNVVVWMFIVLASWCLNHDCAVNSTLSVPESCVLRRRTSMHIVCTYTADELTSPRAHHFLGGATRKPLDKGECENISRLEVTCPWCRSHSAHDPSWCQ